MGSILVPLDGSQAAECGLPWAVKLARRRGAVIQLLRVQEPAVFFAKRASMVLSNHQPDPEAYLSEMARRLASVSGVRVEYQVAEGNPASTIVSAMAGRSFDLVVMSTHGGGAVSRFWLGSVADHVVRHSTVPVFLLRPNHGGAADGQINQPTSILAAVDLSPGSEAGLEPIAALAQLTQGTLTLAHALAADGAPRDPFVAPTDPGSEPFRAAEARWQLERMAEGLRNRSIRVETKVTVGLRPAAAILDLLDRPEYDMAAITTWGTGGVRTSSVGSVADKVIRAASKPVLAIRPRAA